MNQEEQQVREAIEALSSRAPEAHGLAEAAIGLARRRRQRDAVVGALVACAVVVAVTLGLFQFDDLRNTTPAKPAPNPSPSAVTRAIVQEPWTETSAEGLAWLPSPLPQGINPDWANAPALSADPVDKAVAAIELDVRGEPQISVLGDDGGWRRLDVGDVALPCNSYCGPALEPNSIAPDQRRIAIPQNGAVVIIDVRGATAQRFPVAGSNDFVAWTPDGQTVLVGTEQHHWGWLLDVADGSKTRVPFSASGTTFLPDGSALEISKIPHVDITHGSTLRTYVDNTETRSIRLQVGRPSSCCYSDVPLVATQQNLAMVRNSYGSGPRLVRRSGPLVVDIETGVPLAMIPTDGGGLGETMGPLGWLDQDTVIFQIGGDVVAWTYTTGELQRVTELTLDEGHNPDPTFALPMTALN